MQPSESRLINSISDSLADLASDLGEKQQAVLFNVQIALTELLLRTDKAYFIARFEQALALLDEGVALAKAQAAITGNVPSEMLLSDHENEEISAKLDKVGKALEVVVKLLTKCEAESKDVSVYLARVVDWENELYQRRQHVGGMQNKTAASTSVFTAEAISQYLMMRNNSHDTVKVDNLIMLSGGFSKTTVLFDVKNPNQNSESLVIRAEQPLSLLFLPGAKVANEFHVLKLAYEAGIPVAEPLWLEDDKALFGEHFIVSRKASGQNLGSRINVREQLSDSLLHDFVRNLARIHQIPISPDDDNVRRSHLAHAPKFGSRTEAIAELLRCWREGIKSLRLPPSPLLVRALSWLEDNIPEDTGKPVLLHGDYGLHNILVENDRVSCILDWESSNIGDPAEDIAWLLDGLGEQVDRQRIIDIYEKESGTTLSEYRLRYFAIWNVLKFAVICPTAISLFENNERAGIDACQLGLFFTYHGTARLNEAIALAEQARLVLPGG